MDKKGSAGNKRKTARFNPLAPRSSRDTSSKKVTFESTDNQRDTSSSPPRKTRKRHSTPVRDVGREKIMKTSYSDSEIEHYTKVVESYRRSTEQQQEKENSEEKDVAEDVQKVEELTEKVATCSIQHQEMEEGSE